jgi:hypothetical protein
MTINEKPFNNSSTSIFLLLSRSFSIFNLFHDDIFFRPYLLRHLLFDVFYIDIFLFGLFFFLSIYLYQFSLVTFSFSYILSGYIILYFEEFSPTKSTLVLAIYLSV